MPDVQGFDPEIYFGIAAEGLLRDYGARALYYADEALKTMRALKDTDGLDMWHGIHRQLVARLKAQHVPTGVTVH